MAVLKINGKAFPLSFEWIKNAKTDRRYRLSSVQKGKVKNQWYHIFKYENGEFFGILVDMITSKLIQNLSDQEVIDFLKIEAND